MVPGYRINKKGHEEAERKMEENPEEYPIFQAGLKGTTPYDADTDKPVRPLSDDDKWTESPELF